MNRRKINFLYVFLLFLLVAQAAVCQQPEHNAQALSLLEKAMGPLGGEEGSSAIYFEGIAYGVAKPTAIFSLPLYQVHRGGYLFTDGKKFEMQLGIMKALCDGKVMVVIDEPSKMMVVDSLREEMPGFAGQLPDVDKLLDEHLGHGQLHYEGKETVQGKACHRIKATFKEDTKSHVYYWVEVASEKLLLMAEFQESAYDVYWVRKISAAPKDYSYGLKLPKKELETLYGYQVVDYRFLQNDLRNKQ